jgi:endonuclease/exonuclease/phosphatase family metal-dependent hydrolase
MDTGIYSRRPLKRLPEPVEAPSDVTVATLSVRGAPRVELHSVHATAPTGRGETWAWLNALRRLPGAPPDAAVRVLAGDFNATLDHAHLRRLLDRGYRDAADVVGQGLRPTWQGLLTIDHVLVTEEIGVRSVKVIDLPGSDHDAVLAALSLPRSRG